MTRPKLGLNTKDKLLLIAVAAIFTLIVGWGARTYWQFRDALHAKTTEARMRDLMQVLKGEQPERVDPVSLQSLLAEYKRTKWLQDGWGRPFVIERKIEGGQAHYTIISLGRDGRRGPCCRKWVEHWDDNAVLSGDSWLQVWNLQKMRAQAEATTAAN
jgi:hypothetical protein